jgi:adenylate cyclase
MERRLAAIMATDVVGYSRLIRADEEGTLAALKALRADLIDPKITEHHGRIVKLMGDGMLVEFASVVDAVHAAVETQQAVNYHNADVPADKRIVLRIGINLGDVVIDGDDIQGDGVNVAARLESMAAPGGICVSGMVYEEVRDRMDVPFEDLGEQALKNIGRPVRVFQLLLAPKGPDAVAFSAAKALMDRPAIAVLPFDNLSGDPDQEYFVDGLTEDIITTLAAWRSFPVIARNSSFAYKGQSPDVRSVANDLGARYVLEGSVRKVGSRVRITAQLIDGTTGKHVWAKRYDRELEDIFAVQDEITVSIVAEIEPEINKAAISSVIQKRPENLNAWELYLRGLASMTSWRDASRETKDFFEKSIASDPTYADAYAALAQCHSGDIYSLRTDDVAASIATMFDLAKKAAQIDPQNFRVYQVRCRAYLWKGDHDRAVEAGRKAVELNPSSPVSYERLATALTHSGEPEEAETCAWMCLKLSPVDPELQEYYFQLMLAVLGQQRFEEAFEHLSRCLNARPDDTALLGFKTVLLGHLGRRAEAEVCLAEYLSKRKIKSVDDYRRIFVPNSALFELNLEGLRKAGWDV